MNELKTREDYEDLLISYYRRNYNFTQLSSLVNGWIRKENGHRLLSCDIVEQPREIICLLIRKLTIKDVINLGKTCKTLSEIIMPKTKYNSYWTRKFHRKMYPSLPYETLKPLEECGFAFSAYKFCVLKYLKDGPPNLTFRTFCGHSLPRKFYIDVRRVVLNYQLIVNPNLRKTEPWLPKKIRMADFIIQHYDKCLKKGLIKPGQFGIFYTDVATFRDLWIKIFKMPRFLHEYSILHTRDLCAKMSTKDEYAIIKNKYF